MVCLIAGGVGRDVTLSKTDKQQSERLRQQEEREGKIRHGYMSADIVICITLHILEAKLKTLRRKVYLIDFSIIWGTGGVLFYADLNKTPQGCALIVKSAGDTGHFFL